jgi:hypothetical protein
VLLRAPHAPRIDAPYDERLTNELIATVPSQPPNASRKALAVQSTIASPTFRRRGQLMPNGGTVKT